MLDIIPKWLKIVGALVPIIGLLILIYTTFYCEFFECKYKWEVLGQGACRYGTQNPISGTLGTDYTTEPVTNLESCKNVCEEKGDSCKVVEFKRNKNNDKTHCELHKSYDITFV